MKSTRLIIIIIIIIIIRHDLRIIPAYEINLYQNLWNTFHKWFTVDGDGIKVFCIKANLIFGPTNDGGKDQAPTAEAHLMPYMQHSTF